MSNEDEAERIRVEYARRERDVGRDFYSLSAQPNLFIRHGQERAMQRALERLGILPLHGRTVLEVGCGLGQWFGVFENFGAARNQLAGIDLDAARIEETHARYSDVDLRVGDATTLPWADETFDLVFQSTVFTSILDPDVRHAVAREMQRVVKRSGAILWYDFKYNNPNNKNVRGIRAREIRELFPESSVELDSVTLAPPITRRLVGASWLLASVLEHTRVLNTHYFATIRSAR